MTANPVRRKPSTASLVWMAALFACALLLYFVVLPLGIETPSYATQSPSAFPNAMALLIAALAVVLFVMEVFGFGVGQTEAFSRWFFVMPLLAAIYVVLFGRAGFMLSTAVGLAAMLALFGERRWPVIAGISVIAAVGIEVVFVNLLNIPLPSGPLG